MSTTTQKIVLGFALVIAGLTAASSASAFSVGISVGSGNGYYDPYYYGNYSYSGCVYGCYGYSNYYTVGSAFDYNYNNNFWNGGKFKLSNPPKPANITVAPINGLGFNLPARQNTVPVQQPTNVCPTGSSWNGSSCVTASVNCPAGQTYSYGMNICVPARVR